MGHAVFPATEYFVLCALSSKRKQGPLWWYGPFSSMGSFSAHQLWLHLGVCGLRQDSIRRVRDEFGFFLTSQTTKPGQTSLLPPCSLPPSLCLAPSCPLQTCVGCGRPSCLTKILLSAVAFQRSASMGRAGCVCITLFFLPSYSFPWFLVKKSSWGPQNWAALAPKKFK